MEYLKEGEAQREGKGIASKVADRELISVPVPTSHTLRRTGGHRKPSSGVSRKVSSTMVQGVKSELFQMKSSAR